MADKRKARPAETKGVARLIEQARARKLDRIAGAYAVAGWVVVQAASIAVPAFDVTPWLLRATILLVIAGLPIVLFVAWHARAATVPARGSVPAPVTRTDLLLYGLLIAVVLISAAQFIYSLSGPRVAATPPGSREASIAVLPFLNMSGDPTREYFSDGISEELLNDLANAPDLRVAARTSSFAFKGRNIDVKDIGRLLNVSAVVEGSVREEGNRVRITAQLINTADGYHLWSQTYDRELTSILSVQEEIARDITAALTHRLLGTGPKPGRPAVIDPDAYRKYLEGQFALAQRTQDSVDRSIALFDDTTKTQPDFADGWSGLAMAHAIRANNFLKREDIPLAVAAIERARALDPDNVTALTAHAMVSMLQWKWRDAAADLKRARAIAPKSAVALHHLAVFYAAMGMVKPAIDAAKAALVIDPLSFIDRYDIAAYMVDSGQYEASLPEVEKALQLAPTNGTVLDLKCRAYAGMKRIADAQQVAKEIARTAEGLGGAPAADCNFRIAIASGDTAAARKIVEDGVAHLADTGLGANDIATAYQLLGDVDKAMEWYRRAFDNRDEWFLSAPYLIPNRREVFDDPRWKALRAQPEVRDWETVRTGLIADLAPGG